MSHIATLLAKDARAIARDLFLLFMLGYGLLISLALRLLTPLFDLAHLQLYLAPAPPMLGSLLAGTVLGFALIEERETRTWLLLRTVPLTGRTLALYFVGGGTALGLVIGLGCAVAYGAPVVRPGLYVPLLVANALGTPLLMLFLGAFASNKIEGLAIGKIGSSASATPLLFFLLPPAWFVLLAWSPWSWLYLGLLKAHATDAQLTELAFEMPPVPDWSTWLVPVILCVALSALFARRYLRLAQ
jgi:fluoroquinolone transport system permease protein